MQPGVTTAERYGLARARVAAVMLLTLRGTPFLFQGEELGLTDGAVPREALVDVDGRDPERVPMPWEPGPAAGFTTGRPSAQSRPRPAWRVHRPAAVWP
jgi:glycosidase